MFQPDQLLDIARLRHQDDLREAEAERLYQQVKRRQPGLFQQVSSLLSTMRQWLEAQAPPQPTLPSGRTISDQFRQASR